MRPWHSPALAEIPSYETRASPRIVWIMYVVMYSPRHAHRARPSSPARPGVPARPRPARCPQAEPYPSSPPAPAPITCAPLTPPAPSTFGLDAMFMLLERNAG
jgi:hypothetical protein